MTKGKKTSHPKSTIPNLSEPLIGVLASLDELEYGLRGVVRILSGRGKNGKNGYFFEGFRVVFASEIGEEIRFEETFLDYENLKIVIKLPDPPEENRESIRHQYLKQYTLGADDLKTRAAIYAFAGLDEATRQVLVDREKDYAQAAKKPSK